MTPGSPAPDATDSAVVIPVPEAEAVVGPHRARLDPFAAWGVPAHVTVLAPFVPPHAITGAAIEALAAAVASVTAFDCEFPRTRWFGDRVMWLAPRPDDPFRALTGAVSAAFPGYLPYDGVHDEVVPHLTVGFSDAGDDGALQTAEESLLSELPVRTQVRCAWLMTGRNVPGGWRMLAELPLAAG
jgi:2'-5' RNA ligase